VRSIHSIQLSVRPLKIKWHDEIDSKPKRVKKWKLKSKENADDIIYNTDFSLSSTRSKMNLNNRLSFTICKLCDNTYHSAEMPRHEIRCLRRKFTDIKKHQCPICSVSFSSTKITEHFESCYNESIQDDYSEYSCESDLDADVRIILPTSYQPLSLREICVISVQTFISLFVYSLDDVIRIMGLLDVLCLWGDMELSIRRYVDKILGQKNFVKIFVDLSLDMRIMLLQSIFMKFEQKLTNLQSVLILIDRSLQDKMDIGFEWRDDSRYGLERNIKDAVFLCCKDARSYPYLLSQVNDLFVKTASLFDVMDIKDLISLATFCPRSDMMSNDK